MAWDPDRDGPFGAYVRAKGIQVRPNGWTNATRDLVTEGVGKDGRPFKKVRDQLGNDTVQHGADQQSVRINAPLLRVATTTTEERAHG